MWELQGPLVRLWGNGFHFARAHHVGQSAHGGRDPLLANFLPDYRALSCSTSTFRSVRRERCGRCAAYWPR